MDGNESVKFWLAGFLCFLVVLLSVVIGITIDAAIRLHGRHPIHENDFIYLVRIADFMLKKDVAPSAFKNFKISFHLSGWKQFNPIFVDDKSVNLTDDETKELVKIFRAKKKSLFYVTLNESDLIYRKMQLGYNGIVLPGNINAVGVEYLTSIKADIKHYDHVTGSELILVQRNLELLRNDADFKEKMKIVDKLVLPFPLNTRNKEDITQIINENNVLFSEIDMHREVLSGNTIKKQMVDRFFIALQAPGAMLYSHSNIEKFIKVGTIVKKDEMYSPFTVKEINEIHKLANTKAKIDDMGDIILHRESKADSDSTYSKVTFHYTYDMTKEINNADQWPDGSVYDLYTYGVSPKTNEKLEKGKNINLPPYTVALIKEPRST